MSDITFIETTEVDRSLLLELYNDAGWSAYTKDINKLENAIKASLYVRIAIKDEKLIGLIRVIGDGLTIIYIQDILVLEKFRRMKIGTMLITKTLQKFKDVRQKVLLTDDNTNTRLFYESLGFDSCEKLGLVSFIKFE
ncbi:MAG: GNAT family N-acetyltransferase [Candidatus Marinimicrobia bacterium]|jgi:ribosomal protein S18 acetylase RimI-like enzyme|nr:GNAT family N-acetyltransferase [Candidatus Neomarinimicrobiota bacterium]MBT3683891.1 GNAT family N-acetyltransferase [Candidatus Neomarinimicrobiota bacterium]MBT3759706.1 GNAT family N-acetyltransferase [Candidatus Neomarinimicrobiota bacterium]MBT3895888.1 GNAT family N-acetyltransferase [Candidatus Neomarinimicrobiota bacterium]MBT4173103.1 GNAT family N-acetyltransferase [Candidatus Neomarinimicrobiota bacterium]